MKPPIFIRIMRFVKRNMLRFMDALFAQPYVKETKNGIKYHIRPESSLDKIIQDEDVLDDWIILRHLTSIIPKNGVVLDIGANVGHLSMLFAKYFVPMGSIYAYEPDPENIDQLRKNINLNGFQQIHVCQRALQDDETKGSVKFNIRRSIDGDGKQNRGLSSIKNIHRFTKDTISVTASTIDKEVSMLNIRKIDFIKVDVEGAEYLVLCGGKKALNDFKPVIQYEYSNVLDSMMSENNTEKTFYLLEGLGYKQYYSNRNGDIILLEKPDKTMGDVNIICLHSETVKLTLPEIIKNNERNN